MASAALENYSKLTYIIDIKQSNNLSKIMLSNACYFYIFMNPTVAAQQRLEMKFEFVTTQLCALGYYCLVLSPIRPKIRPFQWLDPTFLNIIMRQYMNKTVLMVIAALFK